MNFKLIVIGCIIASIAFAQIAAQCACGAEGEDVCSCSLTRVPRPRPLPRFQPRINQRPSTGTCSSSSNSQSRHQFNPVGDRCSCGNSLVVPAIRPPCKCQVGENVNFRSNNLATNGRRRSGMLGLFGLRGILGQFRAPGIGGVSLNTRVLPRLPTNRNCIIRQAVEEIEADDNSIIT